MNLQTLLSGKFGVAFGIWVGRNLPTILSYPLVNFFAKQLARRQKLSLVQSIQNNQQVVHQGRLSARDLHQLVEEVFVYSGR